MAGPLSRPDPSHHHDHVGDGALACGIVLLLCSPYLSKFAKGIYNWAFIVGIMADVALLIRTWVQKCPPLMVAMTPRCLNGAVKPGFFGGLFPVSGLPAARMYSLQETP